VESAAGTVDEVARQTPEPVRTTAGRVTDAVRETCRELPACP
jgi:hypothetical protein